MTKDKYLPMAYQILGKSQLSISRIAFGCMSLPTEPAAVQSIVDKAIDNGINFFDTADLYEKGLNEINIGKALASKRDRVIIASKAGNQWRTDGSGWDWNPAKEYIISAAEKSLQRLQTDYIDLYQLHGGTMEDPIDETIEAFELLQQQGKIRYYGISSIRPNVIRDYIRRSNIVSVMMQYSLADRRAEESCFALLQENTIGVLARGTMAGGLLAGKPAKAYLGFTENEILTAAKAVQTVTPLQSNMAATAIRFALQHPAVTAAVVGIRTEKQLTDALQANSYGPLSSTESALLAKSVVPKLYEQHR